MIKGTPGFDAIAIMEVDNIKFTEGPPAMIAHAAFVNTSNGKTYGRTVGRNWSARTMAILEELRSSMEADMAETVFDSADLPGTLGTSTNVAGIGEQLDLEAEVPSA